jgi:hypothetical protein
VGSGLAFALGGIAGVGALSYGRKLLLGSSMGIAPGYGSYKKMLKPGAKRGKYLTGDITGLLYGKKKGKKGKKKNSLYKGLL